MPHAPTAWFFFGDSLTQGVDDARMPGGWVSRLAVLAHQAGLCQPATAAAAQMFNAMVGSGLGEEDSAAMIKLLEALS